MVSPTYSRPRLVVLWLSLVALAGCRNADPAPQPAAGIQLSGVVEEVRDAPPYTYALVRTPAGSVWAAVPLTPIQPGSQLRITQGVALKDFYAPGLPRRLDSVVFGVLRR